MKRLTILAVTASFIMVMPAVAVAQVVPYDKPEGVIDFDPPMGEPIAPEDIPEGAYVDDGGPADPPVITNETVMEGLTEEELEIIAEQFEEHYGSNNGPLDQLEATKKSVEEARKRVESYSMTFEESAAARIRTAPTGSARDPGPAPEAPKLRAPVYNRNNSSGDIPPRLFNNVD